MRVPPRVAPPRRAFVAELADGWREVVSRPWVVACMLTFALSNVSLGAFQVLGPVIANDRLGGAAAWGLIGAGAAIGGVVGGAVALRWKPDRPLIPAFLLMVLAQVELLLLIPPFPVLLIAMGAFTTIAAIVISNTMWDTMVQQHIPADSISRVSAYDWMFSLVLQPVAFAAIGPISEARGLTETLLVCTALGIAVNAGVLLVPSVRNLRRREGVPATAERGLVSSATADPTEPPLATSV
jgi:predicted MFS family arabinose efflux permease